MAILLSLVLFIALAAVDTNAQECDPSTLQSTLYELCLEALENTTSDPNLQLKLQKAFYPPDKSESLSVQIIVVTLVSNIDDQNSRNISPAFINCSLSYPDCPCLGSQYCWNGINLFLWSSDSTTMLHAKLQMLVADAQNVLSPVHVMELFFFALANDYSNDDGVLRLPLLLNELPCMPSKDEYVSTLTSVLSWLKVYVKSPLKQIGATSQELRNLRGLVVAKPSFDKNSYVQPNTHFGTHQILILTPALSLIFFAALTMVSFMRKTIQLIDEQIANKDYLYSLYWGTAYTLGWCNLFNIVSVGATGVNIQIILSLTVVLILLQYILLPTLELCVAARATKGLIAPVPKLLADVFCCCILFRKCRFHSRMIHTLALVNIIWFVQTILVPGSIVIVLTLIINPPIVIALISLVILGLLCLIMFSSVVVYLYKTFTNGDSVKWFCLKCVALLILTLFLICIIISVLLWYIIFDAANLGPSGIKGFVLSLIPSAILSVVGFMAKRTLFGESQNNQQQQPTGQQGGGGGGGSVEMEYAVIEMPDEEGSNEHTPLLAGTIN